MKQDATQTRAFADFALKTGSHDIPDEVLERAKDLVLDLIGVGAAAHNITAARIGRETAVRLFNAGDKDARARLLFDGRTASLAGAAYAGATQIDSLDAHDGFSRAKGHAGCGLLPGVLAFGERQPELSGREFLASMVLGYEIACRAGVALHGTVSDYHTSGAWVALAVAALGVRLTNRDPHTLRQAIGIAEYHGPRSQMMREIDNPTMLHDGSGIGALVGCSATLMAQRGFIGAPAITAEAPDVSHFWSDLGQTWTVAQNYIKPYPICRWAHAAIDCVRKLMIEESITADTVAAIHVRTFTESARLFAGVPENTSQAQYSLNYAMATQLIYGRIGPEHISGEGLRDPRVAAIIPKISVSEEPRHCARFPSGRWSDIDVTLIDGRVLHSGDINARGGYEEPLNDTEVLEKLHQMAGHALPAGRINAIWAMRDALLDPATRFADLASLIYPAPEAP